MTVSQDNSGCARAEELPSPTIRVLEVNGLRWSVREVPYPPIDRRSGTCLIFDAESVIRRVRTFPGNWATLNDTELYALSLAV
jgi:hypothetical protein